MSVNINNEKTLFYDFFSLPHNPEELFTLLYLLGKNDNYEIYKAIYNETRDIFCVKIIPLDKNIIEIDKSCKVSENSSKLLFQKLKQETLLMKSLKNCENITQYYGSFLSFKSRNIWLIYEYCPLGSVYDLMKIIDRPLTEEEISIIMNDIIHGLIYIHQLNIIHRNIKITNILLNDNGNAKLNNFSKSVQKLDNEIFISKDKNNEDQNDIKYDILLLGITCIELFKGLKNISFNRKNLIDKIKNNNSSHNIIDKSFLSDDDKYISNEFIEFIQKCVEQNSYKRPTAFELSNHPFIKKNISSSDKTRFINLVKINIEKIENNKKENFIKKKKRNFYNSIYCNTKKTVKSNISINEKNSISVSNYINNTNDANTIVDKLAEFRIEQMKRQEEVEEDKYTSKDLYSNIDNTGINNLTGDSFNTLKESAAFCKRENDKNSKIQKKSLLPKKLFKKEDKEDIKIEENIQKDIDNNIEGNESHLLKKDSDELDFKANWDHLNKYEEIFKSKLSENNINYDYNNHTLNFNDDESIDINSNISNNNISNNNINNFNNININLEENRQDKYIPFSQIKCDIIQLGSSIKQRKTKKSNGTSEYSLKNGENNGIDSKDNIINIQKKFLLSFGNNTLNDIDINKKNDIKEKNSKNDISTCFASVIAPMSNKPQGMMDIIVERHKSYNQALHFRKSKFDVNANIYNDNYDYDFHSERSKNAYLYKYINDYENPKEDEIKNKKTNIIKIEKLFHNKKNDDVILAHKDV